MNYFPWKEFLIWGVDCNIFSAVLSIIDVAVRYGGESGAMP